jgi:hypothetical protein
MAIKNITFEPGYMVLTRDEGGSTRYPVADILRALDIPAGLTYSQVGAIKTLANLIVVLIRTLIDRQVLNESFLENDDYNLDAIIEAIANMGGAYQEPDISVT